ncbi:MAG: hypothetical protein IKQ71_10160 [Lachnospiraceae bacterium]|nr:hypothetical protein [Lachnospiraceae bacterium]
MRQFIFPVVFVLLLTLKHIIDKSSQGMGEDKKAFLEKESEANFVRRQNIDNLPYIRIKLSKLPMGVYEGDDERIAYDIKTSEEELTALSEKRILNLSGVSNTELKLTYGPANLDALSSYDENYTRLIFNLNRLGLALFEAGLIKESEDTLYYACELGSDIRATYNTLLDIYSARNDKEAILNLSAIAGKLNSLPAANIREHIDACLTSMEEEV